MAAAPTSALLCYWARAIGQRVHTFSRERLAVELDCLGYLKVPAVCLCDANFGLLESDEEFVDDLIRTREKRGYPRGLKGS